MFETLCGLISTDADYPARARRLDILRRILDGTIYDVLPYAFHDERGAGGEYIPLRQRRPSVRYPLARIVVDDSLALMFSDGHFPTVECNDRVVRQAMLDIGQDVRLNQVMLDAALKGAVGSVAIQLRILRGRVFLKVIDTLYLTPYWDPEEPDTLLRVVERFKVSGAALSAQGYADLDPQAQYWFMRTWDMDAETWFVPWPVAASLDPVIDPARSVQHGLGFVPLVWIRNLPGGNDIDGGCTFEPAIETAIEIDYQLSQAGRGLKYSSDPTLLIREPAARDGEIIRGGGNALLVSEKGDAKLLEINGTAAAAVIDYVRTLRELALESVHGNRASPDRLTAAQSGGAIELMNQGLIWLADNLRVSYGAGLLALMRMVLMASGRYRLRTRIGDIPAMDPGCRLSLVWQPWYPADSADRQRDAQTLRSLREAGQISRETALKNIADDYGIDDIDAELMRIASEAG